MKKSRLFTMVKIPPYTLACVVAERKRQDEKWGEQNHDPFTYLAILQEEIGELAQAALHKRFSGSKAEGFRTEAVHVAAVALALLECIDRDKWCWPVRVSKLTGCAACDRGDYTIGHADNCHKKGK